ncbi:unnamed protein product, partial [Mesorhabditis belari]|uniref:Uncharacterized protein n=1 Tax=Mesorhabditis belari TaxID=2138241 RepID=A0AAF3J594_9BILA
MTKFRRFSILFTLVVISLSNAQTTTPSTKKVAQYGYQGNTATPPKSQPYTGQPFVYSTTMNPTLNAERAAGILPNSVQNRNSRQIQYQSSTYSPFGSTQFPNQYNNGYNNNQQMTNSQYSNSYNQQYPYTSQQMAYNNGYNSQYNAQSSTPSSYLLRDQNWNYNYRPFNQGYSNGYNGQALYNPLSNQYTSPSSFNQQNGYQTNWNSNYQSNFGTPYKRSQRKRRQNSYLATSNAQSTVSSPLYSNGQSNAFINPQFDPNPQNANPASLIQNPNYKYLTPGLENLYISSYNRMYDPSGNANFIQPTTQSPILSNDAQNQLNYQKIQQDYVGGRDKYQQDNSEVTNNIYGYDYSSSSTRFGRK